MRLWLLSKRWLIVNFTVIQFIEQFQHLSNFFTIVLKTYEFQSTPNEYVHALTRLLYKIRNVFSFDLLSTYFDLKIVSHFVDFLIHTVF